MNSNVLKEVVERCNHEVIRDGNRESFEALMSPDFVNWSAPSEGTRGAETISGKHVGPLSGVEATGENISIDVIDIVRIRDERYIEHGGVNTPAAVVARHRKQ